MENHGREIDSTLNRELIKDGRGALQTQGCNTVADAPYAFHLQAKQAAVGIGGAPTRATTIPTDPTARKQYPVASGVLDYFPDALVAIAHVSWRGNEQHNPGQPLHWARGKSTDEADTMLRHFLERGTYDTDGMRHSAKMAWRALALLQKEIEAEQEPTVLGAGLASGAQQRAAATQKESSKPLLSAEERAALLAMPREYRVEICRFLQAESPLKERS